MDNLKEPIEGISTSNVAASAIYNGPRARTVTNRSATKIVVTASYSGCGSTEPCAAMLQPSDTRHARVAINPASVKRCRPRYRAVTRVRP
jgi:hypothetical protein